MHKTQWIENKILDGVTLQRHVNIWHSFGKKIVFTNGCYDILHRGHLELLAKAADMGNILIVGVNTDASVRRLKGDDRPINHEQDRAFQLASLLCVDAVCLFDEDTPENLIKSIHPDVLVKGGDYTLEQIVGAREVMAAGGKVIINPVVEGFSTTGIIERMKS